MMNIFKYLLICILIISTKLFAATDSGVKPDKRGYIVKVGDQVEDFTVILTDETEKLLSDFKAEIIVLNFFASWCKVCRKEIPHVEKEVWQQFKDKNVLVLGIDYKEDLKTTEKFIKEMGITYPVALDTDAAIFERFARGGVTRNVVLDENLNIIYLTRLFNEKEFNSMVANIRAKLE